MGYELFLVEMTFYNYISVFPVSLVMKGLPFSREKNF